MVTGADLQRFFNGGREREERITGERWTCQWDQRAQWLEIPRSIPAILLGDRLPFVAKADL